MKRVYKRVVFVLTPIEKYIAEQNIGHRIS